MARLHRRRAKPFLINIRCGIPVPLVGSAAAWTGPQPLTQGDGMVDEATDMTAFGGWEAAPLSWGRSAVADAGNKAVDIVYVHTVLLGSLMQNLHKTPKAQIGHFATPHHLHTAQLQVF